MKKREVTSKLFGHALKRARLSRHMTRYRLAKRIGHQQVRITKLENGGSDVRLSSILALLEALDMTPGELLDDMWKEYQETRIQEDLSGEPDH